VIRFFSFTAFYFHAQAKPHRMKYLTITPNEKGLQGERTTRSLPHLNRPNLTPLEEGP
jgi:hypothetical protein